MDHPRALRPAPAATSPAGSQGPTAPARSASAVAERRAQQNRQAQKVFRERQKKHIQELTRQASQLDSIESTLRETEDGVLQTHARIELGFKSCQQWTQVDRPRLASQCRGPEALGRIADLVRASGEMEAEYRRLVRLISFLERSCAKALTESHNPPNEPDPSTPLASGLGLSPSPSPLNTAMSRIDNLVARLLEQPLHPLMQLQLQGEGETMMQLSAAIHQEVIRMKERENEREMEEQRLQGTLLCASAVPDMSAELARFDADGPC
ncbi:uncharacterized protein BJ171DRAFT_583518 [Polychytrium aggregatum]|uniref:uncharacterized protein n=1 Tax=Polychytrium aggregatum TaxID=110093 RepID=UPI0022FF3C20|nr:uncharacterized protein BJ171DRAFT_583518 [Polychytrium aggregatum]KAI9203036.1 hypothetical protein BJ171DRAFT_583518 [Polychytrium aggregatum]